MNRDSSAAAGYHRGVAAITVAATTILALLLGSPGAPAGGPRIALDSVGNFNQPVYVTQPPAAGGIMVVERPGTIRVIRNGAVLSSPFLDIRSLVSSGDERGLLSVAFPPDYAGSRRFYVYFSNNNCAAGETSCNVEIDEFRRSAGNENRALRGSRRRVLVIQHHDTDNHYGGQLQFGAGGLLFAGTGDGGVRGNALDEASLLGKLLRIDPRPIVKNGSYQRYQTPADNPYVGRAGRDEIFSIGFRNPWRFSLDQRRGRSPRIVIADVGEQLREEVDYERLDDARGASFGWDRYEGDRLFDPTRPDPQPRRDPIFAYSSDDASGNCSIIGGNVIRASNLPGMNGRYTYADLCAGVVRSLDPAASPAGATDRSEGVSVPNPTSFGVDRIHRYYVAALGSGRVYRLVPN